MCKAALPRHVSSSEATIILVFNIFLPGVGTMIASVMGRACRCDTFLVGLLQLLLAPAIVGWIWSIWWGIAACGRVGKRDVREEPKRSKKHKQSHSHSHSHSHSKREHAESGEHRREEHSSVKESNHSAEQQPQQGFPQAYPDPAYPDPAYQPPYPADYPATQPPV